MGKGSVIACPRGRDEGGIVVAAEPGVPLLGSSLALLSAASLAAAPAPEPPGDGALPARLSLAQAEELFLARGLDVLIAEANARGAEGDLTAAGAHPNPSFQPTLYYVPSLNHDVLYNLAPNSATTSTWGFGLGLDDNAAIEDQLSGKRSLRIEAAAKALAAARFSVADVKRVELAQLREAYVAAVMAGLDVDAAQETFTTFDRQLALNRVRFAQGAIGRLDLSQVVTGQLEALQSLAAARAGREQAIATLAFLLGARGGRVQVTLTSDIDYRPLPSLDSTRFDALVDDALALRPDVQIARKNLEQTEVALRQAKRALLPDIALNAGYSEICSGATCSSAPGFSAGLSGNLPVLYQQQGEIGRARANVEAARRSLGKAEAQVLSDVTTGYAAYSAAKEQVERMIPGELLAEYKLSRDLAQIQYQKGASSLVDFLFAERAYVAAELEYHQDLANYWSAVYQLEQATNRTFH